MCRRCMLALPLSIVEAVLSELAASSRLSLEWRAKRRRAFCGRRALISSRCYRPARYTDRHSVWRCQYVSASRSQRRVGIVPLS